MADGYAITSGDLDALQNGRNRSQAICPPSPRTLKSVSTYYPKNDAEILEEANLDPFYLEQSLPPTDPWDSTPGDSHDRFKEHTSQFLMIPTVNTGSEISPGSIYEDSMTQYKIPTQPASQLDHSLGFQQYGVHPLENSLFHSKGSFSSSQFGSTPDLSPSSSFSSHYSASNCPESVTRATERLFLHVKESDFSEADQFTLYPCTPPGRYKEATTQPFTPATSANRTRVKETSETMYDRKHGHNKGKPLPALPNLVHSNKADKKGPNSGRRPTIEPSMISPPSLLDPVTLEPHTSHFDRAFFIPATDTQSPAPSPTSPYTPTTTGPPVPAKDIPTLPFDPYCERSVWESDSDTESIGRKSLSRKPIETLRKVRSRAKLRAQKSATKLKQEDQGMEEVPPTPSYLQEQHHPRFSASTPLHARPTRDVFHPSALETMRLVAPSVTSLGRPTSRKDSLKGDYDVDRSAAAAFQAKSRMKDSQETVDSSEQERLTTFCRDDCSSSSLQESVTLSRAPFFRRVWRSLQTLNCRTEHGPENHGRPL